jgi:hypothetical protein
MAGFAGVTNRKGKMKRAIVLFVLGAIVFAGCGGGDSEETTQERIYPQVTGPSREFLVEGEDNAVQTFGREATEAEREAASRVIEDWMAAREEGDWQGVCKYLSKDAQIYLIKSGTFISQKKVTRCAKGLAVVAGQSFSPSRVNNMDGPIDSLRLGEGHGYAQYHGNDGMDWIVPVTREDGVWKVTKADPIERFK